MLQGEEVAREMKLNCGILFGQSVILQNTLCSPCFVLIPTIHKHRIHTKNRGCVRSFGFPIRRKYVRRQSDSSLQKLLVSQVVQEEEDSVSVYTGPSIEEVKREKAASRHCLYKFLRENGICPDDLDDLDLCVSVDVMKDRIEFLHKLGLTTEDINNYPLVLGCSVKKNMVPVLDYLGQLGIETSNLPGFLRRYPHVLRASVIVDLEPVVKHLLRMDIHAIDIPKVLTRYPELLGLKVEGTMSTSMAYLVAIGVSRWKLGAVLVRYPEILGMRVGRVIKPFVEFLNTLGISRLSVAKLIEKQPHILSFDVRNTVKPNIDALCEIGVTGSMALSYVISRYPDIMGIDLAPKLAIRKKFFASTINVDDDEYVRIVTRWPRVVSVSERSMLRHLEFLKGCGVCVDDMRRMILRCPIILALKVDVMRASFDFFQTEMGGKLKDLVSFPSFFTYGLESKVKPRHYKVMERGFRCSPRWLLSCSDEKFDERMGYEIVGPESSCDESTDDEWGCDAGSDVDLGESEEWED